VHQERRSLQDRIVLSLVGLDEGWGILIYGVLEMRLLRRRVYEEDSVWGLKKYRSIVVEV